MATKETINDIEWVKRKTAYCTHWLATNKDNLQIEVVQVMGDSHWSVFAYHGGYWNVHVYHGDTISGDTVHSGSDEGCAFEAAAQYFNTLPEAY